MSDLSLHSTALRSDKPRALAGPSRRFLRIALCGCAFGLIPAIMAAWSLAQQPYSDYPVVRPPDAPAAQLSIREQGPNDLQTEIVRPIPVAAGYSNSPPPGSQPLVGNPTERLAQNLASPEVIRPGTPTVQGTQSPAVSPPGVSPAGAQPQSEPARPTQGIASPFDPTQFRLPTLGLPPGLGTPEPTPEIKREYGQFVEREIAPENTIQVVVGRAKVIVLREKPRRIYIPDENVAGFQVVTDQQFAVVGKKTGRTVLDLWFPDPRDPNDQRRTGP